MENSTFNDNMPPKPLNVEDKLDVDFLFYLSYTKGFFSNLEENQEMDICQAWLTKLCAQTVAGISAKRSRNVYLAHLVLAMQEGHLTGPFANPPPEGKLPSAMKVFGPEQPEFKDSEPNLAPQLGVSFGESFNQHSPDGRMYVATKELPNGRGAFGFIAMTLGEKEPDKLEQEEETAQNQTISGQEYPESIPEEVSALLSKRRSEPERNRLIRFYDRMTASIDDELAGYSPASDHVNQLVQKLEADLVCDCTNDYLWQVEPAVKRIQLLEILKQRVTERKRQVVEREVALDELQKWAQTSGKNTGPHEEILQQEAEGDIKPQNLDILRKNYPECVVDRFIELLKKERHKMIKRQRDRLQMFEEEVKKDQIAIVKEGLEKYKIAKEEWREVAEAVEKVQKEVKVIKEGADRMKAQLERASKSGRHMQTLVEEVNREQEEYDSGNRKNKQLREQLQSEMEKIQGIVASSVDSRERLRKDNNLLKEELQNLFDDIKEREKRCKELEDIVNEGVDRKLGPRACPGGCL